MDRRAAARSVACSSGDKLPKTVSKFGTKADEIFVTYEELRAKYGKEVDKLPLGAVGIYTASQKIRTGLQQLMAGSRNFNTSTITRRPLFFRGDLRQGCARVRCRDCGREYLLACSTPASGVAGGGARAGRNSPSAAGVRVTGCEIIVPVLGVPVVRNQGTQR